MEQLFDQRRPFGFSLSNETLEPQKASSYEVGFRHAFAGVLDVEASLYWMDVEKEIDFNPATFRYGNVGRSRHKGVNLSLEGRFGGKASMFASYALQDATFETPEHEGMQIDKVPRHLGSLGFRYGGSRGWSGNLVLRAVGRQYLDESNRYTLDSYTTLDGRLGYTWDRLELFVAGLNLLGEEYSSSGFLSPREILAPGPELDPTFLVYPAPERTYRAGLRWRWDGGK
jgi:outer membrane receptor protein involved in Fe transport